MIRDFTYIDDIIESIYRLLDRPAMLIMILILHLPIHLLVGVHTKHLILVILPQPHLWIISKFELSLDCKAI